MTYALGEQRYSLFLIVIIGSIAILSGPIILNQISQVDHAHIAVHEIGFGLAVFLTIMAAIGYKKSKITRMLFSTFAFAVLAFGQVGYMYVKILEQGAIEKMTASEEIFDVSVLIMTILFAVGVFYKKD